MRRAFAVASGGLMALIVGALWIGDHPALLSGARQQTVTLDRAIADDAELRSELASLLGGRVDQVTVQHLDLVRDLTVVDVRYRLAGRRNPASAAAPARPAGTLANAVSRVAVPATVPQEARVR